MRNQSLSFPDGLAMMKCKSCDNCSGTGVASSDYNQAMWAGVSEEEAKAYWEGLEKKEAKDCSSENPKIEQ